MNDVDMKAVVGTHDILFMTLDTLRWDVASTELAEGRTPNFEGVVGEWELRHSPGTFTYAAHQAFFAGFLPTPAKPGRHPRLFAARFAGSETTASKTAVFDTPDIVSGLRDAGYYSYCMGGVGFFNQQTALGCVFPGLFDDAYWSTEVGVTDPDSARNQFEQCAQVLDERADLTFMFINVSALHQPNRCYLEGAEDDTIESHAAALRYVDAQLPILLEAFGKRQRPTFFVICADHGTAYGEDGFSGHRLAHPTVTHVPYAHGFLR